MVRNISNSIGKLHKISIAPMMDCTDTHFRMIMRKISSKALLYTEMIVAQSLIHTNNREKFLHNFSLKMQDSLELPTISELEVLLYESLREIRASSDVSHFSSVVINVTSYSSISLEKISFAHFSSSKVIILEFSQSLYHILNFFFDTSQRTRTIFKNS